MEARLGKYELRAEIGRGAVGVVYEGWHPQIARRVAIKTVRRVSPDDPVEQESLERFQREAQAAGRLSHPNIVSVFDYGETDDIAYIVMEFVEGETLKSVLDRREKFSLDSVLRLMSDLLAGLSYSHQRGVVHRDIKPANLMLTAERRVKITDFGIARLESSEMTQVGTVMGTPAYMSPEQLTGQAADARADIYASGVVLYQLLTGKRPFEGGIESLIRQVMTATPPPPSATERSPPGAFDPVMARALARRPEDRWQTADAFLAAIVAAASAPAAAPRTEGDHTIVAGGGGPGPAAISPRRVDPLADRDGEASRVAPPSRPPPPPRAAPTATPRENRTGLPVAALAVIAVVGLAAIGGAGWWFISGGIPRPTEPTRVADNPPPLQPPSTESGQEHASDGGQTKQPTGGDSGGATADTAKPDTHDAQTSPPLQPPPLTPTDTAANVPLPPPVRPAPDAAKLTQAVASVPCAAVSVSTEGDGLRVQGLADPDRAIPALRHALGEDAAAADWQVASVPSLHCDELDALRRVGGAPGMSLATQDGRTRLPDRTPIVIDARMPFGGSLSVDYFSHDEKGAVVSHVAVPSGGLAGPGAEIRVPVGAAGPPYGTDLIVAIASDRPLFRARRSQDERTGPYLAALRTAIDELRHAGGQIAAGALAIETLPK